MFKENREIIDFHMHPFLTMDENSANVYNPVGGFEEILPDMDRAGIGLFVGSVIRRGLGSNWEDIMQLNDHALEIQHRLPGKYIPGFHIHPAFPRESCEEIERMHSLGVNLIGELVPYMMGWHGYTSPGCMEIFTLAQELGMVVNAHPSDDDDMDSFARLFPKLTIVYAHPGNFEACIRNARRLREFDNVYLDICGTGLFRYGILRYLIDQAGKEKLLFGTDYPICNPLMQVAGVEYERLSDDEREHIYSKNAKRLLRL
jgi:predicted TIM-barrel fold metal-dependent hydrolase